MPLSSATTGPGGGQRKSEWDKCGPMGVGEPRKESEVWAWPLGWILTPALGGPDLAAQICNSNFAGIETRGPIGLAKV